MPTDWVVYDKGINLYLENQDEGIRLIVHPWMTTDKAERIATDLNTHAALVEALEEVLPLLSQINLSSEGMRGEATERAESIARAALAAAKGTK